MYLQACVCHCVSLCVCFMYIILCFVCPWGGGSPKYEVVLYVDSGLWFETMTVHELSNFQKYFPLNKLRKTHISGYIRFLSFYAFDSNKRKTLNNESCTERNYIFLQNYFQIIDNITKTCKSCHTLMAIRFYPICESIIVNNLQFLKNGH